MTAAAFQATFCDWKLVKGRKVIQIVFEVPIEAADQAYHVLGGMPDPGKSVWCAIARLRDTNAADQPAAGEAELQRRQRDDFASLSPHEQRAAASAALARKTANELKQRKPVAPEKRLAQQAGICCADPVFRRFLVERDYAHGVSEDTTVQAVREVCGVTSRSEIVWGTPAGAQWERLHGEFLGWRDHDMPARGAAA